MNSTTTRQAVRVFVGSLLIAAALCGLVELFWRVNARHQPPYVLAVLLAFVVPLVAAVLPTLALTWLVVAITAGWHNRRPVRVSILSFTIATLLYLGGDWLASLYGLDPPHVFFLLGGAMRIAALVVPLATIAWLCLAGWAQRRRRHAEA